MRQLKISKQITQRDTLSLTKYLTEVSSMESGGLSLQEEADIAYELRKTKDPNRQRELIHKLTEGNLRFVISVAKQYQSASKKLELNDLIQAGNAGLVKAALRFDETRGFKFISYAVWWIRQSIMQELAEVGSVVRKPLNKIGLYSKVSKIISELEQRLQRSPTDEEIAAELAIMDEKMAHVTGTDITELISTNREAFSIDTFTSETDKDMRFVDTMSSDGLEEMERNTFRRDLFIELNVFLKTLSERDQFVVKASFGIGYAQPLTLDEIAKEINLTKERVRQIKERAIKVLRRRVSNSHLKQYLK